MSGYIEGMLQKGMSVRQRQRSLIRHGVGVLQPRVLHACRKPMPDARVRYDLLVAGGEVDRAEWASVIRGLLAELTRGKKAPLARLLGFSERTIDRWLLGLVDVSEASVRQVAAKSGRSGMDLLIRVGFYTREEMPEPVIPPEDQWIVDAIEQWPGTLSAAVKAKIIAVELERVRRDREERKRRIAEQLELIQGNPDDEDHQ